MPEFSESRVKPAVCEPLAPFTCGDASCPMLVPYLFVAVANSPLKAIPASYGNIYRPTFWLPSVKPIVLPFPITLRLATFLLGKLKVLLYTSNIKD